MTLMELIDKLKSIQRKIGDGGTPCTIVDDNGVEVEIAKVQIKTTIYRHNRNFGPRTQIIVLK